MYSQRLVLPVTRALVARMPASALRAESVLAARCLHTTVARKDIDSAAKYIGAGAATVGVAGSVSSHHLSEIIYILPSPGHQTISVYLLIHMRTYILI
uniref:4-hydroxy-2-oxoglutarate aldolase, mitochondrial n=1 Tax=Panagrellus redivivus TaxID=6233 RepID=A0A7E4W0X7_PANRE